MGDAVQTEGHALLKAVSQGKLRLARLLLEGGAYINEGNERGETALSAACSYGDAHVRARMVRYLLEQGADPNMADTAGRTALMHAVNQRAGANVISLLLKHGADPALKDYSGESALTRALLHTLRDEHEAELKGAEPSLDQSRDCNHITDSSESEKPSENCPSRRTSERTSDGGPPRGQADRASLQLLLEACEGRGQQVLILTCCSQGAHRIIRQYHHKPPERHHCPAPSSGSAHTEVSDRLKLNHLKPSDSDPAHRAASGHTPETPAPPQDTPPQISVNGLPPTDPSPSGPASCDIAASPSDVHVAGAHGEGVFSFNLAPPRPRPPRVLKRLNSEPWGLSVPKAMILPPAQDEAEVQKPPSLAERPQRRHSIETHDSAPSDTERLAERLTERLTLSTEQKPEPPGAPDSDGPTPEDDPLQRLRLRCNLPSPFLGSSSENLSNSSSPLATRRGRQGAGLLERRGSGTMLLDYLSQPRPFLPPLFNPQRPIPDLRSANPAPSVPAPCGPAPRRKKLLRRHSMQPEQMKLLSTFQHVLSENEEK